MFNPLNGSPWYCSAQRLFIIVHLTRLSVIVCPSVKLEDYQLISFQVHTLRVTSFISMFHRRRRDTDSMFAQEIGCRYIDKALQPTVFFSSALCHESIKLGIRAVCDHRKQGLLAFTRKKKKNDDHLAELALKKKQGSSTQARDNIESFLSTKRGTNKPWNYLCNHISSAEFHSCFTP